MSRLPLPPPRPALFPLRAATTARITMHNLTRDRRRVTIDHEPLGGVTPQMLLWWFRNIGGTMDYAGQIRQNYLVWHPLDHIDWQLARPAPEGGAGEEARFRIVEAFARRPEFYIDTTETVEKLDSTGIRLVRRIAGVQVVQLEHTWSLGRDRTHYVSVLDMGARARALWPVNRYLARRVLPEPLLRAWTTHNVEEVGLLEHFLPALYAERTGQTTKDRTARRTGRSSWSAEERKASEGGLRVGCGIPFRTSGS